jgi:signal transduction histidine kinase
MALSTSASTRARSILLGCIGLFQAAAPERTPAWRARPAVLLALTIVTLGVITPMLPTGLIAAILIGAGAVLAVFSSGLNIATTVRQKAAEQHPQSATPALRPSSSALRNVLPSTDPDWAALMARVNHELRTPLNAVIGFSEVMALEMYGPLGSKRYQDYVSHIRNSAGDLLKSAEDTMALTALLSNPQKGGKAVACSLEDAVYDAWSFVGGKSEADLELALPDNVEVLSEPRALRQILVNLLTEAINRTSPGARIALMAVVDDELVEIVVSNAAARPHAAPAASLSMCVARTLLEMQGTSLLEIDTASGWQAVTVLDRAVQPDFFTAEDVRHRSYTSALPVAVAA